MGFEGIEDSNEILCQLITVGDRIGGEWGSVPESRELGRIAKDHDELEIMVGEEVLDILVKYVGGLWKVLVISGPCGPMFDRETHRFSDLNVYTIIFMNLSRAFDKEAH